MDQKTETWRTIKPVHFSKNPPLFSYLKCLYLNQEAMPIQMWNLQKEAIGRDSYSTVRLQRNVKMTREKSFNKKGGLKDDEVGMQSGHLLPKHIKEEIHKYN